MSDKPTLQDVSPELTAALAPLMRAVSDFALAASRQFGQINPEAYAALAGDHKAGLCEPVVVVALSTTNPCAQFCMDVGSQRHIVLSVPMSKGEAPDLPTVTH